MIDPTLELLSLLSPTPAPLKLLYADLGLRSCHDLAVLKKDALERFGVRIRQVTGARNSYVVFRADMRRLREVVDAYMRSRA